VFVTVIVSTVVFGGTVTLTSLRIVATGRWSRASSAAVAATCGLSRTCAWSVGLSTGVLIGNVLRTGSPTGATSTEAVEEYSPGTPEPATAPSSPPTSVQATRTLSCRALAPVDGLLRSKSVIEPPPPSQRPFGIRRVLD